MVSFDPATFMGRANETAQVSFLDAEGNVVRRHQAIIWQYLRTWFLLEAAGAIFMTGGGMLEMVSGGR